MVFSNDVKFDEMVAYLKDRKEKGGRISNCMTVDIYYTLATLNYTLPEQYSLNELDQLLYDFNFDCGWLNAKGAKTVHEDFEQGGRWHNIEITIFQIDDDGEMVYVKRTREVGATEMQGNGAVHFELVERKEKTIYYYE